MSSYILPKKADELRRDNKVLPLNCPPFLCVFGCAPFLNELLVHCRAKTVQKGLTRFSCKRENHFPMRSSRNIAPKMSTTCAKIILSPSVRDASRGARVFRGVSDGSSALISCQNILRTRGDNMYFAHIREIEGCSHRRYCTQGATGNMYFAHGI
jgi:hypothetical protein